MDRRSIAAFAWLALAGCGSCAASEVSRCVTAQGAVLIVDTPCPVGARISWTRTLGPEERSADTLARIARDQRQRMDDAERLAFLAGTLPRPPRERTQPRRRAERGPGAASLCEVWRKRREQSLADGRRVDYDTRRALNDRVFDACR